MPAAFSFHGGETARMTTLVSSHRCVLWLLALSACSSRPLPLPNASQNKDLSPTATRDLGGADLAALDLAASDLGASDSTMRDLANPDLANPDLAVADLAVADLAKPAPDFGDTCHGDGGALLWAKAFVGPVNVNFTVLSDPPGVLAEGSFKQSIDFGDGVSLADPNPGTPPSWLAYDVHLDAEGRASRPREDDDLLMALVPDGQGGRILVDRRNDGDGGALQYHLLREDASGNQLYDRSWGATNLRVHGAAADTQGNLFLTADLLAQVDLGNGLVPATLGTQGSFLLARFDAIGHPLWVNTYDLNSRPGIGPESLSLDGSDGIVISDQIIAPNGIGGAPVTGNSFFIARYDGDGNFQWMKQSGTGVCVAAASPVGNSALACSDNSMDLTIDKYDSLGNTLWEQQFAARVRTNGLMFDTHDNLLWSGVLVSSGDFGQGPLVGLTSGFNAEGVVKLDGNGHTLWSRSLVQAVVQNQIGFQSSLPQQLAVGDGDAIYVTGWFDGALDSCGPLFPSPPLTAFNSFVVKLSP
jgi:hypothetical protein